MSLFQTLLLILAACAVAIADVLLKKTQVLGSMSKALLSPLMLGAIILYLFQIFVFTYLFASGTKLAYVGVMQIILYELIVLGASIFIFRESLTTLQIIGIFLALTGVILLSL